MTMNTSYEDRDGLIWLDGEMIPWRDAKIHILTHTLHYGSGVFEGIRCYNGKIFKLEEHSQRLLDSAQIMDMKIPYSLQEINQACLQAIEENKLTNAYLRPIAWRGTEQMGVTGKGAKIHLSVAAWEWPRYFDQDVVEKGLKLKLSHWRRPSPESAPVSAKACGLYTICTLAKHQAEAAGYHDSIMLDYRGRVAEATGANFFMVKDGEIHTPEADCFLNGITRRTIIELAKKRGIPVHERAIMPDELALADECFITGTAIEVAPVGCIDTHSYQIGPVATSLREDYLKLVNA